MERKKTAPDGATSRAESAEEINYTAILAEKAGNVNERKHENNCQNSPDI